VVREAKDIPVPYDKIGPVVGVSSYRECGSMSMGSNLCEFNRTVVAILASLAIVASPLVWRSSQMSLYKLERYSHIGYLIKVVVMALAGEVIRELSPIRSWSKGDVIWHSNEFC